MSVIVAFLLILMVACGITWFCSRRNAETRCALSQEAAFKRVDAVWRRHLDEVAAENASLRARNEMLVGLVGGDAERAALSSSCADEARRVQ